MGKGSVGYDGVLFVGFLTLMGRDFMTTDYADFTDY